MNEENNRITRNASQTSGDGWKRSKISLFSDASFNVAFTSYYTSEPSTPLFQNYGVHVSLSLKRDRLSAIRNRTIPLFPRQTIDEHGTHDLAPSSFTRNVFARKQGIARRKQMKREKESMAKKRGRRMVSKDLEGSWPKREPLGMELRGGGWRGCTSGEHRGREEASCKEYKQCVLIRAPWPDECTIVALQGFATNPASTRTLAACRSQRSRAPYIRCPAPGRN